MKPCFSLITYVYVCPNMSLPAVTWHSFVFGNCSLHTVSIINFFRVGRVGKPYYILYSEVKEIYNTSYTVTIQTTVWDICT